MFVLCLFFMSLREEKRVFQKRLMCEVEFFLGGVLRKVHCRFYCGANSHECSSQIPR